MLKDFLINFNRLGTGNAQILLTVSGGVDSVVMARLFKEAEIPFGIAHCNFQLRGEDSDGDALFVRQLASDLGVPYHETSFDTQHIAGEWKLSTQMAARKLRYDWFEEIAVTHNYSFIATAHHGGDQVETVLLNLTRGAGIRGLQGMPEINGRVIRPLLFATREQILRYAETHKVVWREDRSNSQDYYSRNRIRHHVVPVLKGINPRLEETVVEMSERLKDAEALLEIFLREWKKCVWSEEGDLVRISIDGILAAPRPAYQLYYLLEPLGFGIAVVNEILSALNGQPGKEFFSSSHILVKDREFLLVRPQFEQLGEDWQVILEEIEASEGFELKSDDTTAYFDLERLRLPVSLRIWKRGDYFKPYGMNGRSKKVSDLLTDQKVNRLDKEKVKVLVDADGKIIWVVGYRGDHTARVTHETRRILKVTVSEG